MKEIIVIEFDRFVELLEPFYKSANPHVGIGFFEIEIEIEIGIGYKFAKPPGDRLEVCPLGVLQRISISKTQTKGIRPEDSVEMGVIALVYRYISSSRWRPDRSGPVKPGSMG